LNEYFRCIYQTLERDLLSVTIPASSGKIRSTTDLSATSTMSSQTARRTSLPSGLPRDQLYTSTSDNASLQRDQDDCAIEEPGSTHTATQITAPRSDFHPFFTLVEDQHAQVIHHPTVHYIFADDDTDMITNAALKIAMTPAPDPSSKSRKPETEERYLLLSLNECGQGVQKAQSMSAEWHVSSADMTTAPTLETNDTHSPEQSRLGRRRGSTIERATRASEGDGTTLQGLTGDSRSIAVDTARKEGNGAMMLRIYGNGIWDDAGTDDNGNPLGLDALCGVFQERLEELREVVERGDLG